MTVDLTAANRLPPLANKLFRIFARFEFALKMAGFVEMRGNRVEVCWDRFANSAPIGADFLARVIADGLAPTMLAAPPKADRVENGQYGFNETASEILSAQDLFGAIRRVRNNLFHGGKYFDDDFPRNRRLVKEALSILLFAAERHPDVNFFFEGRA